jgi:hypothetical protein
VILVSYLSIGVIFPIPPKTPNLGGQTMANESAAKIDDPRLSIFGTAFKGEL